MIGVELIRIVGWKLSSSMGRKPYRTLINHTRCQRTCVMHTDLMRRTGTCWCRHTQATLQGTAATVTKCVELHGNTTGKSDITCCCTHFFSNSFCLNALKQQFDLTPNHWTLYPTLAAPNLLVASNLLLKFLHHHMTFNSQHMDYTSYIHLPSVQQPVGRFIILINSIVVYTCTQNRQGITMVVNGKKYMHFWCSFKSLQFLLIFSFTGPCTHKSIDIAALIEV